MIEATSSPINCEQLVQAHKLNLTTVPKFQDLNWLPPEVRTTDRLTGLPILNNETRNILVNDFSNAIKNNSRWACLYADADQLKTANAKYGRGFGDVYIKWESSLVTHTIDNLHFSEGAIIRVVRPTHAADEIIIWFFDLQEEDLKETHKLQELISQQKRIDKLDFTFSLSSGLLMSDDKAIETNIQNTKKWLLENPEKHAFDLFQQVEDKLEEQAKVEKIARDLSRLPLPKLLEQNNINALIGIMRKNLGGTRISEDLLELILKLQSIQTIRLLKNQINYSTYVAMLRELGVGEDHLDNITTPDVLVELFRDLFGQEDASAK